MDARIKISITRYRRIHLGIFDWIRWLGNLGIFVHHEYLTSRRIELREMTNPRNFNPARLSVSDIEGEYERDGFEPEKNMLKEKM
ncbi:hypothetical protein N665_1358s0020 [Sinapis alba]|nr:hypothetical protein N665_1358s0020 [Sinapis alba]